MQNLPGRKETGVLNEWEEVKWQVQSVREGASTGEGETGRRTSDIRPFMTSKYTMWNST